MGGKTGFYGLLAREDGLVGIFGAWHAGNFRFIWITCGLITRRRTSRTTMPTSCESACDSTTWRRDSRSTIARCCTFLRAGTVSPTGSLVVPGLQTPRVRSCCAKPRARARRCAFLTEDAWVDDDIDTAFVALVRHSSSPVTVEERVVHDASAIELMGAFGIAAAFTQGGAEGRSYEETMVAHERFLERTEFKTPRGQELSLGGREFARQFLARLRSEL